MSHNYSEADVRQYFLHKETGVIYKCVSFCRSPSVTLLSADPAAPCRRECFGVDGLTAQEFVRLVPEDEAERSDVAG